MSNVSFTGHRLISYEEIERLQEILPSEIRNLAQEGFTDFYAGGAIGFDTLASLAVLRVRDGGEKVRLHLILPCKDQERAWRPQQQELYHLIMESADSVVYVAEEYSPGAMQTRNRELIEAGDFCLCYLRGSQTDIGGTAYTVKQARKRGIQVKNLCPQNQMMFEDF